MEVTTHNNILTQTLGILDLLVQSFSEMDNINTRVYGSNCTS